MDHDRIAADAAYRLQRLAAATPIDLARIPGTAISQAMHGLPPPDDQLRDGEVVVPWIGSPDFRSPSPGRLTVVDAATQHRHDDAAGR